MNGEAIYNTRRWKTPVQWSEGRRDYKGNNEHITGDWKTGGDIMLKLTVDPDPGYAVKEIFYTYNPTTNNLYAIFPKYPDNKKIILKDLTIPRGTTISLLSTKESLQWRQSGANVEIDLPDYNPNKIRSPYSYAVRIGDFGRFAAKPKIMAEYKPGQAKPLVTIESDEDFNVAYYIDGTMPTRNSNIYTTPFYPEKTVTLNVVSYPLSNYGGVTKILPSAMVTREVKVYGWKNAIKTSVKPGIDYKYYEPSGKINLNSIAGPPTATGVADIISNKNKKRTDKYAFEFTGYIRIDNDGIYTFFTDSDDGSILYIDDEEIVNNDGDHGSVEKNGKAALKKGFHKIKVLYFDSGGGNSLKVLMQKEGGTKMEIPKDLLFH